jgi:hypothetical protein
VIGRPPAILNVSSLGDVSNSNAEDDSASHAPGQAYPVPAFVRSSHRIVSRRFPTLGSGERSTKERAVETDNDVKPFQRIRIEQHSIAGLFWFAAWLFSIGFLHLNFWKGVLALVIWPYSIGHYVSSLVR